MNNYEIIVLEAGFFLGVGFTTLLFVLADYRKWRARFKRGGGGKLG